MIRRNIPTLKALYKLIQQTQPRPINPLCTNITSKGSNTFNLILKGEIKPKYAVFFANGIRWNSR